MLFSPPIKVLFTLHRSKVYFHESQMYCAKGFSRKWAVRLRGL